jgi:hypothetical protein
MVEQRRKDIVKEINNTQPEYKTGQCKPASAEEILKDILLQPNSLLPKLKTDY